MNTSVLIPTYNSARTIEATLDSVFAQTTVPDEVLIMDDGSTDDTLSRLNRYLPRVTVFQQSNAGVAHARNVLGQRAQGDLLAFLDHDDVWHPEYLETQVAAFHDHPNAVGFFTWHDNNFGFGPPQWDHRHRATPDDVEIIAGLDFLRRYHRACSHFASMSFCCIPNRVMRRLGPQPFHPEVSGVDDYYIFHTLMLLGPIVYHGRPLVAYRITPSAQSASLLKSVQKAVRALELLQPRFQAHADPRMRTAFNGAFAAQRREYGRVLMGVGQPAEARKQLVKSLTQSLHPVSAAKSLVWLFLSGVPNRFQPKWPSEWKVTYSSASQ